MTTLTLNKDDLAEAIRKAFAKEGETFELTAEVFSVGKWNGLTFTKKDLEGFVESFNTLKTVLRVPLKLGHNDKQAVTDGQHALGWVDRVWLEGNKLLARFIDMPEIVFSAIDKKLYKNVSIEASFNVKYKGNMFKNVLTGVALLGADLPAVNNLKDLKAYMSATPDDLLLGDAKCFTYDTTINDKGVNTMSEELLKQQLDELNKKFDAEKEARVKAEGEAKAEKEKAAKLLADSEEAKFNAAKTSVTNDLEALVKDNKLTPAKRDELTGSIKDAASLEQVKFTAETLKDIKLSAGVDNEEEGKAGKTGEGDTATAEEVLLAATKKFQAEGKDFVTAQKLAFDTHPKEAREYIDANEEDAA